MGLSIIVSGAVISIALLSVLFAMPGVVDSIIDVSEVSSQASDLIEEISNTLTHITSVEANSGSTAVLVSIANNGTQKLWNFEDFTLIVSYDADIGGTTKRVTEHLTYSPEDSFKPGSVILIPDGNVANDWGSTTGCPNNSDWECLDELSRSDLDFITTTNLNNDDTDVINFTLSDPVTVPSIITDVIVHYTYAEENNGTPDPNLTVELEEGDTPIALWTELGQLPDDDVGYAQSDRSLTSGEISSIGSYADLELSLFAECVGCPGGGNNDAVTVSWLQLEIQGIATVSTGDWAGITIQDDNIDPFILNQDEVLDLIFELSYPVALNGDVIVSISTDNGVVATGIHENVL